MHKSVRWCMMLVLCSCPEYGLGTSSGAGLDRGHRSLASSFPFTLNEHIDLDIVNRQQDDGVSVDFNSVAAAGQRCIDKIVMEEETEYDEVYECSHSYNRRCHTSYTTTYEAQQEEECEENYKKNCFIQYSPTAYNATVKICRTSLVKDCSIEGPTECSTEYQSECATIQHEHQVEDDIAECTSEIETKCNDVSSGYTTSQECSNWPIQKCGVSKKQVTKYSPETSCTKVPIEICGPSACPVVPGPEECYDTTKTITSEKPEEECSLEPRQACKHVTKLVPQLKPKESCIDVPKEVCTRSQSNPRKVKKPVVKKWCYTPSDESGLADFPAPRPKPDLQGASDQQAPSTANTCPRSCQDAKRRGICDPRCNEYAAECGVPVCQPTTTTPAPSCPAACRRGFQSNGRCEPECDIALCGYDPDCAPPTCPDSCRPGFQSNGRCQPECDVDLCGYDPDCDQPSYAPPPKPTPRPTTTTRRPTTTRQPTTTTPPACPRSCRPGFQSNGRCEVQCHIPGCGYDPDCNKPVKQPENTYLPPAAGSGQPGYNVRGLAPPSRRNGRRNSARVSLAPASSSRRQAKQNRAPAQSKKINNNWDLFFNTGLIKRRG